MTTNTSKVEERYHPSFGYYTVTVPSEKEKSLERTFSVKDATKIVKENIIPVYGDVGILFVSGIVDDPSHLLPIKEHVRDIYYRIVVLETEDEHILVAHIYMSGEIVVYDDDHNELIFGNRKFKNGRG